MTNPTDALLAKIEELRKQLIKRQYFSFSSIKDAHDALTTFLLCELEPALTAAAQRERELVACCAAYKEFLSTEMHWEYFRHEFLSKDPASKSVSSDNARKIKEFLGDNGDPGGALLAEMETLRQRAEEAERKLAEKQMCLSCFGTGWIDTDGICGCCSEGKICQLESELAERDKRIAEMQTWQDGEPVRQQQCIEKQHVLAAELARVKAALEWYADKAHYHRPQPFPSAYWWADIDCDGGSRARIALAPEPAPEYTKEITEKIDGGTRTTICFPSQAFEPSQDIHNMALVPEYAKHLFTPIAPERCWLEDYEHENGQYQNQCYRCNQTFIGHKRRVLCKACAPEPVPCNHQWAMSQYARTTACIHCGLLQTDPAPEGEKA